MTIIVRLVFFENRRAIFFLFLFGMSFVVTWRMENFGNRVSWSIGCIRLLNFLYDVLIIRISRVLKKTCCSDDRHSFSEDGDKYLLVSVVCYFFIAESNPKNRATLNRVTFPRIGLDLVQLAIQYSLRTLFSPKVPEVLPTASIFLLRAIRLKAINKRGNLLGQ